MSVGIALPLSPRLRMPRVRTTSLGVVLAAVILLQSLPGAHSTPRSTTAPPENGWSSLPAAALGAVSAGLGAHEDAFRIRSEGRALTARNAGQDLTTRFTARGAEITAAGGSLALSLAAVGYGNTLRRVRPVRPTAHANRVEYRRPGLVEWYANGPLGLEQGFTLSHRPGTTSAGRLTLALALAGDFAKKAETDGRNATFGALAYRDLVVTDSRGSTLPATLELREGRMLIHIADRDARYPLRVDPFVQLAKLTAADASKGAVLGSSVAIDGDTIVAGAPAGAGAAYVFVKPPSGWASATEQAKLLAPDGGPTDQFGRAVAVSGNTVVVGAPYHTAGTTQDGGTVYVFASAGGAWTDATLVAELTASGSDVHSLGYSVGIDGTTIVAGAPSYPIAATCVYVMPGGGWADATETARLTSSDGAGSSFGDSVGISDDTVVVGAPFAGESNGAAYVFSRPDTGWATATQTAKLTSGNGYRNGRMGTSVAVDGDTIAVGLPVLSLGGSETDVGAVFVFIRPAGGWADSGPSAFLGESDPVPGDELGSTVAMRDGRIVAGVQESGGNMRGSLHVFVKNGRFGWGATDETARLRAKDGEPRDFLSAGVASDGDVFVGGAPGDDGTQTDQGSVYVFAFAPETSLDSQPPSATNQTIATFTFSSDAGSTFTCRLDDASYAPCTSPATYSGLTEGAHTFRVKAVDDIGTPDPTPAKAEWTVDLTPPQTSFASHPSARSDSASASFGLASSEPGSTFECSLDGAGATACSSPAHYDALEDGGHSLSVAATDPAGNTDPTPATYSWTVDTHRPTVVAPRLSLPVGSVVDGAAVPVTVSWPAAGDPSPSSGIRRYILQQRAGSASYVTVSMRSPTSRTTTASLDAGAPYDFRLSAVDWAGNQSKLAMTEDRVVQALDEAPPTFAYTGKWSKIADGSAGGGTYRLSSAAGSTASARFSGPATVGLVSTKGPRYGRADVFFDGSKVATLDLYAATKGPRVVAYTRHVPSTGTHTLKVVVRGDKNPSARAAGVVLDGLLLLH